MGDLVEERGSGRSALWFWRQTFAAIADSVARDLWEHKLLAVRAVATGWAMNWAWGRVIAAWERHESGRIHYGRAYGQMALFAFTFLVWPAISGWVVALSHRAQQAAMVLAYVASLALYASWDLSAHYSQMKACVPCSPDLWDTNLAVNCIALFLTLIGGFLPRPRPTIEGGAAS
jgi:hypothetical protein